MPGRDLPCLGSHAAFIIVFSSINEAQQDVLPIGWIQRGCLQTQNVRPTQ